MFILATAMMCVIAPASAAVSLTLNASENVVHIGDALTLSGSITGMKTIAAYLFVTGPDLDTRGVTLDNLNIPAGHGLFTTAPVHLENGTWSYIWDTAVILGKLKPGTYTIYVVSSPVDRLRYDRNEYAATEVVFYPSYAPQSEVPLGPGVPVVALGIVGILCGIAGLKRK